MKVRINDDFDLHNIVESGQCFRPILTSGNKYRFIYRNYVLYIEKIEDTIYDVSCTQEEWDEIWTQYFDLDTVYSDIRNSIPSKDAYIKKCSDGSVGIRILRQDKWEMLISYIISQRKSIPAIRSCIEKICELCGDEIKTDYEILHLFPNPNQLADASLADLAACGLGYRLDYIVKAAEILSKNPEYLKEISIYEDDVLFEKLLSFKGVGKKVANCVMLFAYHRTGRAPVDVWIQRVMDEEYNGINPFDKYGEFAGIMQQYVFFYRRMEDKFSD